MIDQISRHRSIRKYKPTPVPEEILQRILAAAVRASSSGNMQAYSIIVTENAELKSKLLPAHFYQTMVTEAPLLLTFCSDFYRMRRWLTLKEAPENFDNLMSFMIGAIDAILAAQNAALAAESEGLGICFMGTTLASCDEIARLLECPEHVVPVVGFSLGYPAEDPAPRDRLPLKGLVHFDKYRTPSDKEVLEIYEEREKAGWERYMSSEDLKKKVFESGATNLAQIYTKLKYTRESHTEYSEAILKTLRRQKFLSR